MGMMKFIVTLISSVLVGLTLGASGFSPLLTLQRLMEGGKKVIYAIVLGITAFIFTLAAVISGVIEVTLQLEAQGFLMWSALFSAATTFLALGAVFGIVAKVVFPDVKKPDVDLKDLSEHPLQLIEFLLQNISSGGGKAKKAADTTRETAPPPPQPGRPLHEEIVYADPRIRTDITH
jgi:hypothetical protein